jgi:hypothetical protein
MRRLLSFSLFGLLSLASSFAQDPDPSTGFIGNGYYRIKNKATERYIYVTDNKDYYDMTSDRQDFQAIQLWKGVSKASSDPATVIYMEKVNNNNQYDLKAQGTGVHSLTGYYITTEKKSDNSYEVFATKSGVTKYLSDDEQSDSERGKMGTGGILKYRKWLVDKIETNHATNYVGIKPTIELNGKFYQPYYVAYPFRTASPDMHIYYICGVQGNKAFTMEIEGDVPASTPVIIECASADPSQNRIELLVSTSVKVTGNKLSGVYFCNGERPEESVDAYKLYDATTMRVFDAVDGEFVLTNTPKSNLLGKITQYVWDDDAFKYIPKLVNCIAANTSYLNVTANTPNKLIVSLTGDGINDIKKESSQVNGVYSISGTQIRTNNSIQGLPAGLYIVGGKKIAVK